MTFLNTWTGFLTVIGLRYFVVAGAAYLIWYKFLRKKISHKKIQLRFPASKDYRREIGYSIVTMCIFALTPVVILETPFRQYTQFYTSIPRHGSLYFWLAFPLTFLIHDTYFYWMHRLMHHRKLFKFFHVVHHKSVNPSPWAAFAFQPTEAIFEAGIFIVLVLVMPIHVWHLVVFFFVMIVYNVYGHLGWELYPAGFSKSRLGKWINTSINHNQHHQFFKGNYGLYFLWWDRWMGTIRHDYDEQFERVTARKPINSIQAPTSIPCANAVRPNKVLP